MQQNRALRNDPMMNITVAVNYINHARNHLGSSKLNSLEGLMGSYNAGAGGMSNYLKTGYWNEDGKHGQKQYTFRVYDKYTNFNSYMKSNLH